MGKPVAEAAVACRVEEARPDVAAGSVDEVALVEEERLEASSMPVDEPLALARLTAAATFAPHRPKFTARGC